MKFYRIRALMLKYWYISTKRLDRIFDLFYWPLIDIFMWGLVTYFIKDISEINLLPMFLGGFILWIILWRSSVDLATYILEDFWSRNLYNTFTSPVKVGELVVSLIIFGAIRSLISFTFLGIISFIMYSFNILTIGVASLAVFIPALLLMGWFMGILLAAAIFRWGQRIQVFAWSAVWLIQPFSCVTYPLASLPGWAQTIAQFMPPTYIFESMRNVLATGTLNLTGLLYTYTSSVALIIVASFAIYAALRKAKKTGLLIRIE